MVIKEPSENIRKLQEYLNLSTDTVEISLEEQQSLEDIVLADDRDRQKRNNAEALSMAIEKSTLLQKISGFLSKARAEYSDDKVLAYHTELYNAMGDQQKEAFASLLTNRDFDKYTNEVKVKLAHFWVSEHDDSAVENEKKPIFEGGNIPTPTPDTGEFEPMTTNTNLMWRGLLRDIGSTHQPRAVAQAGTVSPTSGGRRDTSGEMEAFHRRMIQEAGKTNNVFSRIPEGEDKDELNQLADDLDEENIVDDDLKRMKEILDNHYTNDSYLDLKATSASPSSTSDEEGSDADDAPPVIGRSNISNKHRQFLDYYAHENSPFSEEDVLDHLNEHIERNNKGMPNAGAHLDNWAKKFEADNNISGRNSAFNAAGSRKQFLRYGYDKSINSRNDHYGRWNDFEGGAASEDDDDEDSGGTAKPSSEQPINADLGDNDLNLPDKDYDIDKGKKDAIEYGLFDAETQEPTELGSAIFDNIQANMEDAEEIYNDNLNNMTGLQQRFTEPSDRYPEGNIGEVKKWGGNVTGTALGHYINNYNARNPENPINRTHTVDDEGVVTRVEDVDENTLGDDSTNLSAHELAGAIGAGNAANESGVVQAHFLHEGDHDYDFLSNANIQAYESARPSLPDISEDEQWSYDGGRRTDANGEPEKTISAGVRNHLKEAGLSDEEIEQAINNNELHNEEGKRLHINRVRENFPIESGSDTGEDGGKRTTAAPSAENPEPDMFEDDPEFEPGERTPGMEARTRPTRYGEPGASATRQRGERQGRLGQEIVTPEDGDGDSSSEEGQGMVPAGRRRQEGRQPSDDGGDTGRTGTPTPPRPGGLPPPPPDPAPPTERERQEKILIDAGYMSPEEAGIYSDEEITNHLKGHYETERKNRAASASGSGEVRDPEFRDAALRRLAELRHGEEYTQDHLDDLIKDHEFDTDAEIKSALKAERNSRDQNSRNDRVQADKRQSNVARGIGQNEVQKHLDRLEQNEYQGGTEEAIELMSLSVKNVEHLDPAHKEAVEAALNKLEANGADMSEVYEHLKDMQDRGIILGSKEHHEHRQAEAAQRVEEQRQRDDHAKAAVDKFKEHMDKAHEHPGFHPNRYSIHDEDGGHVSSHKTSHDGEGNLITEDHTHGHHPEHGDDWEKAGGHYHPPIHLDHSPEQREAYENVHKAIQDLHNAAGKEDAEHHHNHHRKKAEINTQHDKDYHDLINAEEEDHKAHMQKGEEAARGLADKHQQERDDAKHEEAIASAQTDEERGNHQQALDEMNARHDGEKEQLKGNLRQEAAETHDKHMDKRQGVEASREEAHAANDEDYQKNAPDVMQHQSKINEAKEAARNAGIPEEHLDHPELGNNAQTNREEHEKCGPPENEIPPTDADGNPMVWRCGKGRNWVKKENFDIGANAAADGNVAFFPEDENGGMTAGHGGNMFHVGDADSFQEKHGQGLDADGVMGAGLDAAFKAAQESGNVETHTDDKGNVTHHTVGLDYLKGLGVHPDRFDKTDHSSKNKPSKKPPTRYRGARDWLNRHSMSGSATSGGVDQKIKNIFGSIIGGSANAEGLREARKWRGMKHHQHDPNVPASVRRELARLSPFGIGVSDDMRREIEAEDISEKNATNSELKRLRVEAEARIKRGGGTSRI